MLDHVNDFSAMSCISYDWQNNIGFCAGENPEQDKLRAAARLVENAPAVVKFAARGCGQVR